MNQKELLDSLPNNIDTWNKNKFSMSEETLEQNLWSICDAFKKTSSIERHHKKTSSIKRHHHPKFKF